MAKYIDADELLRRLSRKDADEGAAFVAFVKSVVEMRIEQMPSADVVEVKRGRWKGAGMGDYNCSLCGHLQSGKTNYCPNCGAKMDEVERNEN